MPTQYVHQLQQHTIDIKSNQISLFQTTEVHMKNNNNNNSNNEPNL